ncbi:MAG TPA: hypothetical protein VM364_10105 [Vicinamibacterales bacterium]|nr:hypothetical protein [Vicinamibacterales bacterium]
MWITLLALSVAVTASHFGSQAPPQPQAPPGSEVYVAAFSPDGSGITVGTPENVSNSPGYDNQPFFSPDGASLYFTSGRGGTAGATQTDIYRYDLAARRLSQVTSTPESEYSPTVTPDGRHLSVIRVEADQTQRLWQFTLDGKSPSLVLTDIKPVGYHAWLDASTLALFVLGQPPTLQIADTRTGKAEIVATNIGQSVQRIPGGGVSFVQQAGQGPERTFTITKVAMEGGKAVTKPLIAAVPGAAQVHVAWTPDGTLLMAHDGALHAWRDGDTTWRKVADLKALGLEGVTRLAVSPRGDRIAIVAAESR